MRVLKEPPLGPEITSRGAVEEAAGQEEPERSLHGLGAQLVAAALFGCLWGSRDW